MKYILPILLTLLLFSLWAMFALTIVNPYMKDQMPGYVMGRICVWEYVALIISVAISFFTIKKWGNLELVKTESSYKLSLDWKYGLFLLIYFTIAISVGLWQFCLFSQKF